MIRLTSILAALFGAASLLPGEAQASSVEISPVTVNLAAGQTATTIRLHNRSSAATAIQVRAYAWSQDGDRDALAPTKDIILSPPIFTVQEGGTQTIRLMLRGGTAAGERNFRILVDEVPVPNVRNQEVAIAMRISLPVTIAAATPGSRNLQWRARRGPPGQILLSASNKGQVYDKIHMIDVTLADGSHVAPVPRGDNPYVLAGATREWIVKDSGDQEAAFRMSVTTQAGKTEQMLALDR